jgi:hypothetical protein
MTKRSWRWTVGIVLGAAVFAGLLLIAETYLRPDVRKAILFGTMGMC